MSKNVIVNRQCRVPFTATKPFCVAKNSQEDAVIVSVVGLQDYLNISSSMTTTYNFNIDIMKVINTIIYFF